RGTYRLVLPMEDADVAVVSRRRAELPAGCALPFVPDEVMHRAANKYEIEVLAESLGGPVPITRRPQSAADLPRLATEVGFPMILKPCEGFGSRGVSRVDDASELGSAYPALVASHGPMVMQSYVPEGGGEYGVSLLFDRAGEVRARFTHRRVRS